MSDSQQALGSYRLIERIGSGGMGEVWKAEDTRLGRIVAIKIVVPQVADDPEMLLRLRREARTAAQLNHPNIATIHAIEEAEGRLFVVMEFVEGEPLSKIIKRGAVPEGELCAIGRSVADALGEAHAKGIIHRDIKPDNIIVSGPKVKVLDFGIAKQIGSSGSTSDAPTATFMTQQGMIVGTIQYMSPEQALGKPLDARTDIFSLGVVLYQAATGQLPFQGETVTDTITRIIRDEAREPMRVNPSVSPALSVVIRRCMRKNPGDRYATSAELSRALDAQLERTTTARTTAARTTVVTESRLPTVRMPERKTPWGWIAAVVAVLALGAFAFAIRYRSAAPPPMPAATTTSSAAPAPAKQAVTVTAPPAPTQVTSSAPAAKRQASSATATDSAAAAQTPEPTETSSAEPALTATAEPAPETAVASAHDHLQRGHRALLNRNFPKAIVEYQQALDRLEDLDQRERALAHLGMAISNRNRPVAQRISQEIARRWPGDPDFESIRETFGGMTSAESPRPMRRRPRP